MKQNKIRIGKKLRTILTLLALVVIGMGSTILMQKEVTLIYDGIETVHNTTSTTVEEFLEEKSIDVLDDMYIEPVVETEIADEMVITVKNLQDIIILDNGEERRVKSAHSLVKDILDEHKYELKEQDYSIPAYDEEIEVSEQGEALIIISRVYKKSITEIVNIPFESEIKENSEMLKGQSKVVTEGINGSKTITTAKIIENDVEVSSSTISEEIVNQPINQVTEIGTKVPEPAKVEAKVASGAKVDTGNGYINGRKIKRVITMEATAYDASAESNGQWVGITALGTNLRPGIVAVDQDVIPLGSTLYIESTDSWPTYGMARAEDTGGAIKGNKIDLFFSSSQTVKSFGRRNVKVYVLE